MPALNLHFMTSIDRMTQYSFKRPTCPVCATQMDRAGVSLVTFSGGMTQKSVKYLCRSCRVETHTTGSLVSNVERPLTTAAA